jgi:hypothetical protein
MNRRVRRRLEMALKVRDFSRARPSADASHASVLGRLEATISRMEEVGGQQVGGFLSKHSSTVRRKDIRRRLHAGLLRHLVTIAQDAAVEKPELTAKFQLPPVTATNKAFQTVARKMLEQGKAEQELLLKHGLGGKLLEDLSAAVDEFDASVAETNSGLQGHILARAELESLSEEIMLLVGMLDGINQYRFEKEPEVLVAWESAKHVVSGPQVDAAKTPPPPAPADPGQPKPGEVKPAA